MDWDHALLGYELGLANLHDLTDHLIGPRPETRRYYYGSNFGALSRKVGGLGWGGTALAGYFTGLFAQILIFSATWLSYAMNIDASYFRHWDALNAPPGTVVPMAKAMATRAGALVVGPIAAIVPALIGRLLSALAPEPAAPAR